MKDAYSFHESEESLDNVYNRIREAYLRIFKRCSLDVKVIEADPGDMGGRGSHEFIVPSPHGEDRMILCGGCGYAANREWCAASTEKKNEFKGEPEPMKKVDTPGASTVEQVCAFLKVKPDQLVKSLIYSHSRGETLVMVRGDHEVSEPKLARILDHPVMADEETVQRITGASVGFAGPVGLKQDVPIIADHAVAACGNAVTGANQDDTHLMCVNPGRDFEIAYFHDLRMAGEGDPCPQCGSETQSIPGIEVGHIFKLGTTYSDQLEARFSDIDGTLKPLIMGCYGIGINRIIASYIETSHDENGIIWKGELSPFDIVITAINYCADKEVRIQADSLYEKLSEQNYDVLLDDRDERPGSKFSDADLVGIPLRITIGNRGLTEGIIELKERSAGTVSKIPLQNALSEIQGIYNEITH
jgi:prolyl-tRNA synthetase